MSQTHHGFGRRARVARRRKGYSPSRRLRCEMLEDRRLLAMTVDTLIDEVDGSVVDGDISLRDAIAAAVPGDFIDFAPSLDGGTILLEIANTDIKIGVELTIDASSLPNGIVIDAGHGSDGIFGTGDGIRILDDSTIARILMH